MAKGKKNVAEKVELIVCDEQPMVSSLVVAEHFEKRHDDVLKAIKNLACSKDFGLRNFAESSYVNSQNKEQPCINMTRDGFSILAMGFTGKKAMAWKERYIEAFNAMEKELAERPPAIYPAKRDEIQALKGMIHYWAYLQKSTRNSAEYCIAKTLRVPDLDSLDALDVQSAWKIVQHCMETIPPTILKDSQACNERELEPIHGLLTYWAYRTGQTKKEVTALICDRLSCGLTPFSILLLYMLCNRLKIGQLQGI